MPDFGSDMDQIFQNARRWIEVLDGENFFSVLLAFTLALTVVVWVIYTVRNPPKLDF
jgi:hypothetical protein